MMKVLFAMSLMLVSLQAGAEELPQGESYPSCVFVYKVNGIVARANQELEKEICDVCPHQSYENVNDAIIESLDSADTCNNKIENTFDLLKKGEIKGREISKEAMKLENVQELKEYSGLIIAEKTQIRFNPDEIK